MGNCNSKLHVKHTSFTYPTAGLSVDWRPDTQNGNSNNSSSSRNSGSSAAGVFGSTDSGSQRNPSETQQQPSRQDGSDGGNAGTEGGKGSSNGATAEAAKAPRPDAYELTEEEVQAMLHCLRLRQRHGWGEIVREARAEWLGWRLKFAAGEKVGDRADYARRVESWAKREFFLPCFFFIYSSFFFFFPRLERMDVGWLYVSVLGIWNIPCFHGTDLLLITWWG